MTNTKQLLKATVGSQAHGLAGPDSDFHYRGVFIVPTEDLLKLGSTVKHTNWQEAQDDDTSWEIGHFLNLATKSNPTILETFLSPVVEEVGDAEDREMLKSLFPYVWSSKAVLDAFVGYGHSQRRKMLEGKDKRTHKYAAAYLRVLWNAIELLQTGTFTIRIVATDIGPFVKKVKFKDDSISLGEIIDKCNELEEYAKNAYEMNPGKVVNYDEVNEVLLALRQKYYKF